MCRILFLLFITLSSLPASASLNKELLESKKCSSMFAYFEDMHKMPENTLHSISLQETQKAHSKHYIGIVWPWTVTAKGKGNHFDNRDAAIAFAKAQIAAGNNNIDIGCMQINLKYHPEAFASIEQAFSPKHNIAYGANFLKNNYNRLKNWSEAIGLYHSATENKSSKYQKRVSSIRDAMISYKDKLQKIANPYSKKMANKNSNKESRLANIANIDKARTMHARQKLEI